MEVAIEVRLTPNQAVSKQFEFEHKSCGSNPMSYSGIFLTFLLDVFMIFFPYLHTLTL